MSSKWDDSDQRVPKICKECTWQPTYTEDTMYYDCCREPRECALAKARRVKAEKRRTDA